MVRASVRGWLWSLLLVGPAFPAAAQQPAGSSPHLAREVAGAVVDFYNDPRRVRFIGPARVPSDSTVHADLAALEGPLVVAGRVEGSIVMVNGEVELRPGATVMGDILVVGGAVTGEETATVRGEITVHQGRLAYRREGDRIRRVRLTERDDAAPDAFAGRSDFLITTGRSYNRVEGLPITFGPRIRTEGRNPLRVHALGIYRTESGFTLDVERMGYYVRAEQSLGGRQALRVGATTFSLVDPIEEWHLTDLENGLATFLFHQDYRDYFEREGASVFSTWEPLGGRFSVTAEARWESHRSLVPGNPWTVFDNSEPWRLQPLVAEGDLTTLALRATYDTRSDPTDPATGWYLSGRVLRAVETDLARPPALAEVPGGPESPALPFGSFGSGRLEVRRYNRVDPTSRLNFRFLLAGALGDGAPPPQFQHALGGEGSLPGYTVFSRDCGARATAFRGEPGGPAVYRDYGCDAVALFQTEYRGKLSFRFDWGADPWSGEADDDHHAAPGWGVLGWDFSPDWVVFVDVGRGWARGTRPDEPTVVDAGVGVLVDRFGIYAAVPLSGGSGVNLFVRLGPRF